VYWPIGRLACSNYIKQVAGLVRSWLHQATASSIRLLRGGPVTRPAVSVADPEDTGAKGIWGLCPSGSAGDRAPARACGGKAPPPEDGVLMRSGVSVNTRLKISA